MTVATEEPVFAGKPTGPSKYVAELGEEVPTFLEEPGGRYPALKHHVPLTKRGFFRPDDLANFDADKSYRTDTQGWTLCYHKLAERYCKARAINRWPRCKVHGGRVHPLDQVVKVDGTVADNTRSRYQQFLAGQITVEDLDFEELTSFGFRTESGKLYKPRKIPRQLADQFTRAIFDRATDELKTNVVEAAKTLAAIMTDKTLDPAIRLKAAEAILDRNLGKAPQIVAFTGTKPWEEVFESILGGSRETSRKARHVTPESEDTKAIEALNQEIEIVDAEIVEDNQNSG